jgi:hypothetical protein
VDRQEPDFDLARDLPTTPEDVAALRAVRLQPQSGEHFLATLAAWNLAPPSTPQKTFAGWAPFELEECTVPAAQEGSGA